MDRDINRAHPSRVGRSDFKHGLIIQGLIWPSIVVTGQYVTGSLSKSSDQIGKNCPKMSENCAFSPPDNFWTFFAHFSTFFGHFVDIPFFCAVQRFARYSSIACHRKAFSAIASYSAIWGFGCQCAEIGCDACPPSMPNLRCGTPHTRGYLIDALFVAP